LYMPPHLNILNLPDAMVRKILKTLKDKLNTQPQGYLKNSYENLIKYYTTTTFKKNLKSFYYNLGKMDQRRNQNGRLIFADLFHELNSYGLE